MFKKRRTKIREPHEFFPASPVSLMYLLNMETEQYHHQTFFQPRAIKASRITCFNVKWPLLFSRKFILFRPKKRSLNIGHGTILEKRLNCKFLCQSRVLILVKTAEYFLQ